MGVRTLLQWQGAMVPVGDSSRRDGQTRKIGLSVCIGGSARRCSHGAYTQEPMSSQKYLTLQVRDERIEKSWLVGLISSRGATLVGSDLSKIEHHRVPMSSFPALYV